MHTVRLGFAIALLAPCALQVPALAQITTPPIIDEYLCADEPVIDYNRDGKVDGSDWAAFTADFNAGSLRTDFTGDGLLGLDDLDAYCSARPNPNFQFYWQVGTDRPIPGWPDNGTGTPVPVSYDNLILYEQFFEHDVLAGPSAFTIETFRVWRPQGIIAGYHLMLCDNRPSPSNGYTQFHTYANWQANYTQRMDRMINNIGPMIGYYYPVVAGIPTGIAVIDLESANPAWVALDGHSRLRWYELLEDIGTPNWDPAFFALTGCAQPNKRFGQLSATELNDLAECTWRYFSKDYTLRILNACKAARSAMQWGFYEVPIGNLQAGGFNGLLNYGPTHWEAQQGLTKMFDFNNDIDWLLREVDVYLPMIYPPRVILPYDVSWFPNPIEPVCLGQANGPPATLQSRVAYRTDITISEAYAVQERLRPPVSPAKPVVAFYSLTYGFGTWTDCFDNPADSQNTWTNLIRAWLHGCDGMVIWGAYSCRQPGEPCHGQPRESPCVIDCTQDHQSNFELYLHTTRWAEAMRLITATPEP